MSERFFDELSDLYTAKIVKSKIKDEKVKAIIEGYAKAISSSYTLEQLVILKLLILSGDDMYVDTTCAEEFHKAYRSWGVIDSHGLGSHDTIMWNLLHMDDTIWQVLEENGLQ